MRVVSETERISQQQTSLVLEALPVLRRWLRTSAPRTERPKERQPLPLSHVRALIHLYQNGPLTVGGLARGLGISNSTATECVAGLEAQGRVVKERSTSDRRCVVVRVTPEAAVATARVLSQRSAVVERALQQLSSKESRAFVRGLALLSREAESWMDQTPALERDTLNGGRHHAA